MKNVKDSAASLEYFFEILKNIWVPRNAPPTPTALGNPKNKGLFDTSLAAKTVTVIAAMNPIDEKPTDNKRPIIFLLSECI